MTMDTAVAHAHFHLLLSFLQEMQTFDRRGCLLLRVSRHWQVLAHSQPVAYRQEQSRVSQFRYD
jgi:hypothetical protein